MLARYRAVLTRAWDSPTITTYAGFLGRTGGLVILLPLILIKFSTEEVAIWYLFAAVLSLQLLMDFGLSPTFSRVIAYAMAGSTIQDFHTPAKDDAEGPSWSALERVCQTMLFIYRRLSVVWFTILLTIGTLAVWRPISAMEQDVSVWCAWGVIVLTAPITFYGLTYSAYLQGINKIALLRRWEFITSILSTGSCVVAVLYGGDVLFLTVALQLWSVINVLRNKYLVTHVLSGRFAQFNGSTKDPEILKFLWPSVWRTGIGALAGFGSIQASGVLYAQIATPAQSATYLLSLRMIRFVSELSQAPFYSKLPGLAMLYAQGRLSEMTATAKRGMRLSYLAYVLGFALLGFFGDFILITIGSNADFPEFWFWALLGFGYFLERYGAMHINLFSCSNVIINHVANGVTGAIFLVFGFSLFPYYGIYAAPVAIIVSNIGFYAWFAASRSYRKFGLRYWNFEKTAMMPFLLVMCVYFLLGDALKL